MIREAPEKPPSPAVPEEKPARYVRGSRAGSLPLWIVLIAGFGVSVASPAAALLLLCGVAAFSLVSFRGQLPTVLLAYAAVLLLVPSRYTIGPFAVTASMLIGLTALLLWTYSKLIPYARLPHGTHGIAVAALLLLGAIVVSDLFAYVRPLLDVEARGIQRQVAGHVVLTGVLVAVAEGIGRRFQLDRILRTLVLGGAVVAVIGILQFTVDLAIEDFVKPPGFKAEDDIGFIEQRAGFNRVAGTARHPIEMGVVWSTLLLVGLHYSRYALSRGGRQLAAIASLLMAIAIPMALSRTAVAVLVVGAVLLLPTWDLGRRLRIGVMVAVLLLGLAVAVPGLLSTVVDLLAGREATPSLQGRAAATERGWEEAWRSPIHGRGFGTYDPEASVVKTHLDNFYPKMFLETGLLGLTAFGMVIAAGVLTVRRIRRASDDPAIRDLAQTLLAVVAALTVAGWGLDLLRYPMLAGLLFLVLGSIAALERLAKPSSQPPLTRLREVTV